MAVVWLVIGVDSLLVVADYVDSLRVVADDVDSLRVVADAVDSLQDVGGGRRDRVDRRRVQVVLVVDSGLVGARRGRWWKLDSDPREAGFNWQGVGTASQVARVLLSSR